MRSDFEILRNLLDWRVADRYTPRTALNESGVASHAFKAATLPAAADSAKA